MSSFSKVVVKAVKDYAQGTEGWREISTLAGAANADLYYGDTSTEDYPGFGSACREVSNWLSDLGTLYVDEDSGCVSTREPQGEWVEGEDGDDDTWCKPLPYSMLEQRDLARILFGSELAQYL